MLSILLELFRPLNTDPVSFCRQNATIHTYYSHLSFTSLYSPILRLCKIVVFRPTKHHDDNDYKQQPSHWCEPRYQ